MNRVKGGNYKARKDAEAESERRKELRKRDEDELAVSKVFAWGVSLLDFHKFKAIVPEL